jgi:hypothetical protein
VALIEIEETSSIFASGAKKLVAEDDLKDV